MIFILSQSTIIKTTKTTYVFATIYLMDGHPIINGTSFRKKIHRIKDKLHFEKGLLFKDHKLIIPYELQRKTC